MPRTFTIDEKLIPQLNRVIGSVGKGDSIPVQGVPPGAANGGDKTAIVMLVQDATADDRRYIAERLIPLVAPGGSEGVSQVQTYEVWAKPLGTGQRSGTFTIFADGAESAPISFSATAEDFLAAMPRESLASILSVTGGKRLHLTDGDYPGRWYLQTSSTVAPGADTRLVNSNLSVSQVRHKGTGKYIAGQYAGQIPETLTSGTICLATYAAGRWWFAPIEGQPDPPDTGDDGGGLPAVGGRVVLGGTETTPHSDRSPFQYLINGDYLLTHAGGGVYESDSVDELSGGHWKLTLLNGANNRPDAKLELITDDDALYLLFWCGVPFDDYGSSRFRMIGHASYSNDSDIQIHNLDYTLNVSPFVQNCLAFGERAGRGVAVTYYALHSNGVRYLFGPPDSTHPEAADDRCIFPSQDSRVTGYVAAIRGDGDRVDFLAVVNDVTYQGSSESALFVELTEANSDNTATLTVWP